MKDTERDYFSSQSVIHELDETFCSEYFKTYRFS